MAFVPPGRRCLARPAPEGRDEFGSNHIIPGNRSPGSFHGIGPPLPFPLSDPVKDLSPSVKPVRPMSAMMSGPTQGRGAANEPGSGDQPSRFDHADRDELRHRARRPARGRDRCGEGRAATPRDWPGQLRGRSGGCRHPHPSGGCRPVDCRRDPDPRGLPRRALWPSADSACSRHHGNLGRADGDPRRLVSGAGSPSAIGGPIGRRGGSALPSRSARSSTRPPWRSS
jgi:hypothetical protein